MQIIYSFILIFSLLSTAIFAQEQIGVAAAVNRNTTDLTLEQERKLVEAGYQIIQNHTIETDEIGKAQMLLLDGTAFSVGPNSSVVLDRFIYNPETAEGSLEVTARGLLRIVGGKVTKKQPALIRTNSATVGIRGWNWDRANRWFASECNLLVWRRDDRHPQLCRLRYVW